MPRRSREVYEAYEALTEPEVRAAALAVLDNPVFRYLLVDLQEQVIQNIKITPPGIGQVRFCLTLAVIDTLLGALIGQAFEARSGPADE